MKFLMLMLISFSLMANDDPWEDANRAVFEFNQTLDKNAFEPVARGYQQSVPQSVQNRVSDFSSNLGDVATLGNELAQFKLFDGAKTLGRVLINSTAGLLGLFDVASDIGLEKTSEDFGQTLAVWGAPEGNYVVLPILGPSTVRDSIGTAVNMMQNTESTKSLTSTQKVVVTALKTTDVRVQLLPATNLLKRADDPYIAMRSAYLQKRQFDVFDGDIPDQDDF